MPAPVRRWLGIDFVDLVIQVGITAAIVFFVDVTGGPEGLYPVVVGGSFAVLGFRRRIALRKAALDQVTGGDRLADLEYRLEEVETLQDRVVELEERLDFAERLLTKRQESTGHLPQGG